MKCLYINLADCVAVFTPHFREQVIKRQELMPAGWTIDKATEFLNALWDKATIDQTFGVKFGSGYLYGKKIYNGIRKRFELELISFTPADNFHTQNRTFAKLITL